MSNDALDHRYDTVIGAVSHDAYRTLDPFAYASDGGLVADLKRIWGEKAVTEDKRVWSL
jgi:UDP-N-acetyl-D-mannosaminuronate dehydrogenase